MILLAYFSILKEAKACLLAYLLKERLSTVEEKSLDIGVGWLLEPSVE